MSCPTKPGGDARVREPDFLDDRVPELDLAPPVALKIDEPPRDGLLGMAHHARAAEGHSVGVDDLPIEDDVPVQRRADLCGLRSHPGGIGLQFRRLELDDERVPHPRGVCPVEIGAAGNVDAVNAPRHELIPVVRDGSIPEPDAWVVTDRPSRGDTAIGIVGAVELRGVDDQHLVAIVDVDAAVAEVLVRMRERRRPGRRRRLVVGPVLDGEPERSERFLRPVVWPLLDREPRPARAPGGGPRPAVPRDPPVRSLWPGLPSRLTGRDLYPLVPGREPLRADDDGRAGRGSVNGYGSARGASRGLGKGKTGGLPRMTGDPATTAKARGRRTRRIIVLAPE